jgi:hypothetical protein
LACKKFFALLPPRLSKLRLPLSEIARVLVLLDHVARFIENANHSLV